METKKRILIVDDEQINLEFFDVMLSKLGFDVHMAEDGHAALESVQRLRPDLIILDNIMPKLSGWEVTRMIKSSPEYAEFADTPIIMFSALDDVKDKVEGLELGADDYITKPFNFAEVLARIRVVLRTHELIGQIENREKRIRVGDKTIEELNSTVAGTRKALSDISGASDLASARSLAGTAVAKIDELEKQLSSLRRESEGLRKESTDIVSMHRKPRA